MQCFTFSKVNGGQNVFELGDYGNTFFVIIKGVCTVLIRNPQINEWYSNRKYYKKLLAWKKEEFDHKVKEAKL